MPKPIIALDCDDVLVNFTDMSLVHVNREFGTNWTREDVTGWDFPGMNASQRAYMYTKWHDYYFYDECRLTAEQQAAINALRDLGRVIVVSSPIQGHMSSKMGFLLRYFVKPDIIFAKDKALINADVLVDDSPDNITAWPGIPIVMDRPWNRDLDPSIARVYSLTDVPARVDALMDDLWTTPSLPSSGPPLSAPLMDI